MTVVFAVGSWVLVLVRSGHVHNQLDFFSRQGWKLPDSLRAQLKFDPFMTGNRHEKCSYGKYEFKDEKQAKLLRFGCPGNREHQHC